MSLFIERTCGDLEIKDQGVSCIEEKTEIQRSKNEILKTSVAKTESEHAKM